MNYDIITVHNMDKHKAVSATVNIKLPDHISNDKLKSQSRHGWQRKCFTPRDCPCDVPGKYYRRRHSNETYVKRRPGVKLTAQSSSIEFQCSHDSSRWHTHESHSRTPSLKPELLGPSVRCPCTQALHQPRHTRHSLHAGSGAGYVMYTLEGTKQSGWKPWTSVRNSQRT